MKRCLALMLSLTLKISALTLTEAYQAAKEHAPLSRLPSVIAESARLTQNNLNVNYWPSLSLTGKATEQSKPTLPTFDKEQYSLVAEATQLLWDGGATRASKRSAELASAMEEAQNRVNLHALKQSVNHSFFTVLLSQEYIGLSEARQKDLERRLEQVEERVKSGVADETDLATLEVEILKLLQERQELKAQRRAALLSLEILTGLSLGDSAELLPPPLPGKQEGRRPELSWFEAQENLAQAEQMAIDAKWKPRFSVFGQMGYGKPGLAMSPYEADSWWMAGGRLYWDISAPLLTRSTQMAKVQRKKESIDIARAVFLQTHSTQIGQKQVEIEKLDSLVAMDHQAITLRHVIRVAAEAKEAHGTLTLADLLSRCEEEENAKRLLAQHSLQRIQAFWDLHLLLGNDNKAGEP